MNLVQTVEKAKQLKQFQNKNENQFVPAKKQN